MNQQTRQKLNNIIAESFTPKDLQILNEYHKKRLHDITCLIFFDLRGMLIEEKYEQAKDLVDCFHNTFLFIDKEFSFQGLKRDVAIYHKKYPEGLIPYLEIIADIQHSEE